MRLLRASLVLVAARGGGSGGLGLVVADTARCRSPRETVEVSIEPGTDAARDRRGLGAGGRADVAAAALRMVPLVGTGAHRSAPAATRSARGTTPIAPARQDGARRRDARRRRASIEGWTFRQIRAELAQAPSRSSRPPRRLSDGELMAALGARRRLAGRAVPPRHLRLQQGLERPRAC